VVVSFPAINRRAIIKCSYGTTRRHNASQHVVELELTGEKVVLKSEALVTVQCRGGGATGIGAPDK
jgi:hypothetical protein